MTTLLRDVLMIPERAGAEDYVLRLTDSVGVASAARTLDDYVVTPALADAFDAAMGLVAESITSGVSRGAFLTGSFGSGKSHFMAVLHALLRHDPAARAKAELQPILAGHDEVLLDRKVLPVAFHLLGAESMEQALFAGYLRQVSELHPGAPLPAIHQSDAVLVDAERMRQQIGDDQFFAGPNGGAQGTDDAWATLLGSGTWTAGTYDAARAAAPGSEPAPTAGHRARAAVLHRLHAAGRLRRPRHRPGRHRHPREGPRLRRGRAVPRRARVVAGLPGAEPRVLRPRVAEAHQAGGVCRRLVVAPWDSGQVRWWTWAGAWANGVLATALAWIDPGLVDELDRYDNRYVKLRGDATAGQLRQALQAAKQSFGEDLRGAQARVSDEALKQLKFAELLPPALAAATLSARAADPAACAYVAAMPLISSAAPAAIQGRE